MRKTGDVQTLPTGVGALVVDDGEVVGWLVVVDVDVGEVVGGGVREVLGDAVGDAVAEALGEGDAEAEGVEPSHVTVTTVGLVAV